jgi:hypothetical protein
MNPLRIFLFSILTAGFVHAQSLSRPLADSDAHNLLINSNFENGTDGWELIAFEKKGAMSIDTKELFNGKQTLRIDNVGGDFSFVRQIVTGKPNTRYRFSGHIKTRNVAPLKPGGRAGAILVLGMSPDSTRSIEGTKSWTKVSFDFTTKDNTEIRVGPGLGSYGNANAIGTAWYSELKLIELGGNTRN